jgi:hypothetical protein
VTITRLRLQNKTAEPPFVEYATLVADPPSRVAVMSFLLNTTLLCLSASSIIDVTVL